MTNTKIIKTSTDGPFENHKWKYELMLPDWLAKWDVYDYWEKERIFSIERELKQGDVLFDIGAESGWLSALYAKYVVGGENIVLFEPSAHYWALIKQIWDMNHLQYPRACFQGLVGAETKRAKVGEKLLDPVFPKASELNPIEGGMPYEYIHTGSKVKMITIDDFVKKTGIVPKGITIDIEGAELLAIRGAVETLATHNPIVWISIHPDLMLKNYKTDSRALITIMKKFGYKEELLAVDHEEHYLFKK